MSVGRRLRGQPLVVLGAVLLGWAGARVTSASEADAASMPPAALAAAPAKRTGATRSPDGPGPQSQAGAGYAMIPMMAWGAPVQMVPVWSGPPMPAYGPIAPYPRQFAAADGTAPFGQADLSAAPIDFGPGAAAEVPVSRGALDDALPQGLLPLDTTPRPGRYGEPAALLGGRLGRMLGDGSRISADAWTLMRGDARPPRRGVLPATYGGSQAGAVLRYRLAMQSGHKPTAYVRTTATLTRVPETSAALGLSVRPLPAVPIVAAVEGRVTEQAGRRRLQPAAMAVTELAPVGLPAGLRAEVYGQGGYVGGRYATPFADGQVRVDRGVLSLGRAEARVGAGAWGGIQKGASRLDAGPAATVSLPLSPKVFGRVAVDWRFRVAGNAEPDSGPAVTVAAGF